MSCVHPCGETGGGCSSHQASHSANRANGWTSGGGRTVSSWKHWALGWKHWHQLPSDDKIEKMEYWVHEAYQPGWHRNHARRSWKWLSDKWHSVRIANSKSHWTHWIIFLQVYGIRLFSEIAGCCSSRSKPSDWQRDLVSPQPALRCRWCRLLRRWLKFPWLARRCLAGWVFWSLFKAWLMVHVDGSCGFMFFSSILF